MVVVKRAGASAREHFSSGLQARSMLSDHIFGVHQGALLDTGIAREQRRIFISTGLASTKLSGLMLGCGSLTFLL